MAQRPPQRSLTKTEPLLVSMWLTKLFRGGPFFWHRIPYAAAVIRCDAMRCDGLERLCLRRDWSQAVALRPQRRQRDVFMKGRYAGHGPGQPAQAKCGSNEHLQLLDRACNRRFWTASSNGSRKLRYAYQWSQSRPTTIRPLTWPHFDKREKREPPKQTTRIMNKGLLFRIKSGRHKQPETMDSIGGQHM